MLRGLFLRRSVSPLFMLWRASYNSAAYNANTLTVVLQQGYPTISVPLPSRKESCDFTLRPFFHNVNDLLKHIQAEDGGIESVGVYSMEGNRVARSTGIEMLLQKNFDLRINDYKYRVEVPKTEDSSREGDRGLGEVRNMVHKLYHSLNVDVHQLSKGVELRGQMVQLQEEISPLQVQRDALEKISLSRSNLMMWGGMAFMSVQLGFLARLTWWEYSWDIMEPVTFFLTYSTSIVMFAYFIITRAEYTYPGAKERAHLNNFHKLAEKNKFDISRYNHLKESIVSVEEQLARLHDPLQLNLPTLPPMVHQTQ